MTPYVSKIAKSFGANVPLSQAPLPSPPGAAPGAAAPSFQLGPPKFQGDLFRSQIRNAFLQGGGRIDLGSMPSFLRSSFVQEPVPIPNAAPPPGAAGPLAAPSPTYKGGGKGISLPATFKQTHETSNLGWPAIDIMGKPGTPVRTPMGGTILRHGSAQGGEALYLDTNGDGEGDYWLGHVTQMAPVGSTVKPGQVIAYISPDHPRPHAHWARR
jgi:biotin carboxyl carrier protein